ncbi:MAG: glycosyl hydrolase [Bacteroidota bacterium]
MKKIYIILISCFALTNIQAQKTKTAAADNKKPDEGNATLNAVVGAMKFRSIGPAVTSGRIGDLAVNPNNTSQWYVVAAAGGVWKTDNAGTSFYPIFDGQGSSSIGCVTIDPTNENTVWVGTGENNNQRSVGYGDGVYKSEDGGATWKNMGLKNSEHIGMIVVDPKNSNTVYVAAYGPLWSAGGERGIYKTTDGGATWNRILFVSDNTGFNEVQMDPRHHNILYASAHQRRRHEWTYVGGGPESAIYRSTDHGTTWQKLENGLPKGDIGRIGMAVSPVNPDYIYAIIEAGAESQGLYLSKNRGASWEKRSGYATAGNYYNEIFADPVNVDRIYSMNTWAMVSNDGGKTFNGLGEKNKHVDNHVIWVDPKNTRHYLMGCDGGLYESWDAAATWQYKANLPVTQFYRVTVDNALPFYNVYGGTQDNNTLGGPSRTISANGIHNYDWFVTVGGDGFKTVVDSKDPNIVYSQWQYGGLVRYNKKTGEALDIKPQEPKGEKAYRFNWDAPLHLSYHSNTTLYFASQKLFKSTDRGNTWEIISPDLTRGIDRNKLMVMDKIWSMDAVAKNQSTSIYGNITAFAESPKNSQLLYAGTDDGLIQVTTDGGKTWTKSETFAGVPNQVLVQNITASQHDENIAYAIFNNHRNGDFKPYILRTTDKGKTWQTIQSDLPARGSAQCITEDHTTKDLLFAGTDFGVFVSVNGGKNWTKMSGGLPNTCIKEIVIQARENDLVLATFGRGFYIVDDYSPLQKYAQLESAMKTQAATIFPIKDGLVFIPSTPLGHKGKSFQGESFYTADNPAIGAVISYYIKDDYKSLKDLRKEREEKQLNDFYPPQDSMRIEDRQAETFILAVIADDKGNIVRQLRQPATKGMSRLLWDGRMERTSPVTFYSPDPNNPYEGEDKGPLCIPGTYTVTLKLIRNNEATTLAPAQSFVLKSLFETGLNNNQAFNTELAEFRRVVNGVNSYCNEMAYRMNYMKRGAQQANDLTLLKDIAVIEEKLYQIGIKLVGDHNLYSREFETLPGLAGTIEGIVGNLWSTTESTTTTYRERLSTLKAEFTPLYSDVLEVKTLLETLERKMELLKLPYTPGRLPEWKG